MNKENTAKLFKRFYFFHPGKPVTDSLMVFGFECVSKGSRVLMEDFSQKNIEEIEIGDKIIGVSKEGEKKHYKIVTGIVQNKVNKGIKKCSLLKNDFSSLFLTEDHEVLCFSYNDHFKWKPANSINKNHKPIFFNIEEKNEDFNKGWIIGLLESDGYIINKRDHVKYIGIKLNDKTLMNQYVDALEKYYKVKIKEVKETTYIKNSPNSYILEKYSDSHEKKLFVATIYKNKDVKVVLNNKILKDKTHDFLRGWLAGFIDGDGTIYKNRIDIFQKNKIELLKYVLDQLDINYSKKLYKNCDDVFTYHIYTAFETMINCCNYKMKKQWENTSLRKQPRYDSEIIIDNAEEKEVYDLTTTCSNFVANGFIVHNCSNGWFDIIWELCEKIEKEIEKNPELKGTKFKWYEKIWETIKLILFEIKLQILRIRKNAYKKYPYIKAMRKFKDRIPKWKYEPFEVIQVKEKFGTLRFYTNFETKEISNYIDEAESKSEFTCEVCGKEGELRDGGWLQTLCDEHSIVEKFYKE